MFDSRKRFDKTAGDCQRYRPSYPDELIVWVVKQSALTPQSIVVDLGCGTGISTRLFAAKGFEAVGIDPSEEMLAGARAAGGSARGTRAEDRRVPLRPANDPRRADRPLPQQLVRGARSRRLRGLQPRARRAVREARLRRHRRVHLPERGSAVVFEALS